MLKNTNIFLRLQGLNINKSMSEINRSLNKVKRQDIEDKYKLQYSLQIWDKMTEINGLKPADILSQPGFKDAEEIFMVYHNGKLILLQPFVPGEIGFKKMSKITALTEGEKCIAEWVERDVDEEVFNLVLEDILT